MEVKMGVASNRTIPEFYDDGSVGDEGGGNQNSEEGVPVLLEGQ